MSKAPPLPSRALELAGTGTQGETPQTRTAGESVGAG